MELKEHKKLFEEIIKKYNLSEEKKALEISNFLTKTKNISLDEFSTKFKINKENSKIFLDFILKGIKFKNSNKF